MSSNFQVITTGSIIPAASGSFYVDIKTKHLNSCKLLAEITYNTTSSTTGISGNLYGGMEGVDPAVATNFYFIRGTSVPVVTNSPSSMPKIGDNPSPLVSIPTFTPSAGSTQTKRYYFYLNTVNFAWSDITRLQLTNNDPTVAATLNLYADIS